MNTSEYALRKTAIHLLRSGKSPAEVAHELDRSLFWVYKWQKRFFEHQDWQALQDQPHTPQQLPPKLQPEVLQAIRQTRSELEAEAVDPQKLSYIGAPAILARLRMKRVVPLPSLSSIERELRAAHLVRPRTAKEDQPVRYPHLHPTRPLRLIQVDIVPQYLLNGPCVSCFNAIDVVSRYPTGQQFVRKSSTEAAHFLLQVWRELGIPEYTQVDNEGCFSGGATHPGVLGKVLRLALAVGTQLVFSPLYHPESNGYVERFHQDYLDNVWKKIQLSDLEAVQFYSQGFFAAYRHSQHHSALDGHSPADLHPALVHSPWLPERCSAERRPLTAGQVHFIRRVDANQQVMILNLNWDVPGAKADQGVWATLQFASSGASLRIYDAAPDADEQVCLAEHVFALNEPVVPLCAELVRSTHTPRPALFRSVLDLCVDRILGRVSSLF